ncbi:hypothetical protein [Pseudomonas sp. LF245]
MSKVIQSVEELDAVLHWRGKHAIAVRERDGLQLSLNTADQTIDDLSAAVSRRTKRVRELEARLAYAVYALNEVVKASAIYEKPFEIATLAIGEISAMAEQPAPVTVREFVANPVPDDQIGDDWTKGYEECKRRVLALISAPSP